MTSADNEAMTALRELLDERGRYEGWLKALEQRKDSTPQHVFSRVQTDYSLRLERVLHRLAERTEQLQSTIDVMTSQLSGLKAREADRTDARQEAELRAVVGEYSDEEWNRLRDDADREIQGITAEREALEADLSEMQRIIHLTHEKAGSPEADAPSAEPEEPPSPGTSNPAPAQAAHAAQAAPHSVQPPAQNAELGRPNTSAANTSAANEPGLQPNASPPPSVPQVAATPVSPQPASAGASGSNTPSRPFERPIPAGWPARPASSTSPRPASGIPAPSGPIVPRRTASLGSSDAQPDSAAQESENPSIENFVAEWPVKPVDGGLTQQASPSAQGDGVAEVPEVDEDARGSSQLRENGNASMSGAAGHRSATTPVADPRREQEKTLKCPECGTMNYATEWYCERCGGELATF